MTSVTVSLNQSMKDFVDQQVSAGGFGTAAEYIEALLRAAQKEQVRLKVERHLREGAAPEAGKLTSKEWERLEQEVRDSHADLRLP